MAIPAAGRSRGGISRRLWPDRALGAVVRRHARFHRHAFARPEEKGGYWLTIDRWASREAFDRFQKSHGKTYRRIDAEMREIAGEEEFIGTFEEP